MLKVAIIYAKLDELWMAIVTFGEIALRLHNSTFFPHKLGVIFLDFWVKFGENSLKRSHYTAIRWISRFEVAYSFVHTLLLDTRHLL